MDFGPRPTSSYSNDEFDFSTYNQALAYYQERIDYFKTLEKINFETSRAVLDAFERSIPVDVSNDYYYIFENEDGSPQSIELDKRKKRDHTTSIRFLDGTIICFWSCTKNSLGTYHCSVFRSLDIQSNRPIKAEYFSHFRDQDYCLSPEATAKLAMCIRAGEDLKLDMVHMAYDSFVCNCGAPVAKFRSSSGTEYMVCSKGHGRKMGDFEIDMNPYGISSVLLVDIDKD